MHDDVFCLIIRGEIPSTKVYEDPDIIAILDISQVTRGHTLVIPKFHCEDMLHCPSELLHRVMDVAQRIGLAAIKNLGASGVNILTNVGEVAGQSVKHFHVHVIPRYDHDIGGFEITMKENNAKDLNLPVVASELSKNL